MSPYTETKHPYVGEDWRHTFPWGGRFTLRLLRRGGKSNVQSIVAFDTMRWGITPEHTYCVDVDENKAIIVSYRGAISARRVQWCCNQLVVIADQNWNEDPRRH